MLGEINGIFFLTAASFQHHLKQKDPVGSVPLWPPHTHFLFTSGSVSHGPNRAEETGIQPKPGWWINRNQRWESSGLFCWFSWDPWLQMFRVSSRPVDLFGPEQKQTTKTFKWSKIQNISWSSWNKTERFRWRTLSHLDSYCCNFSFFLCFCLFVVVLYVFVCFVVFLLIFLVARGKYREKPRVSLLDLIL